MTVSALCADDIEINFLKTPFGVSFLFHTACFVKFVVFGIWLNIRILATSWWAKSPTGFGLKCW